MSWRPYATVAREVKTQEWAKLTLKIGLWGDMEVLDFQEWCRDAVMRGGRVLDKMGGVCGLLGAPAMSPWTSHPWVVSVSWTMTSLLNYLPLLNVCTKCPPCFSWPHSTLEYRWGQSTISTIANIEWWFSTVVTQHIILPLNGFSWILGFSRKRNPSYTTKDGKTLGLPKKLLPTWEPRWPRPTSCPQPLSSEYSWTTPSPVPTAPCGDRYETKTICPQPTNQPTRG